MKIAILYICTGKYSIFWDSFYRTCQDKFYPNIEKNYFVFTDDEELIKTFSEDYHIHPYYQSPSKWPYGTLMRYNIFSTIQDKLLQFDFCYFWNANAYFFKIIDENIIPFPTDKEGLLLWRHTWSYNDEYAQTFDPEQNPSSEAYYPKGEYCHDYGGGFFGGTSRAFVKMSATLRDRVAKDLENGIIAIWHDQSHLLKYSTEVEHIEVPRDTIVSEEYMDGDPYAIFLNKNTHGGMYNLRGMSFKFRIKNTIIAAISTTTEMLRIKSIIKRLLKIK